MGKCIRCNHEWHLEKIAESCKGYGRENVSYLSIEFYACTFVGCDGILQRLVVHQGNKDSIPYIGSFSQDRLNGWREMVGPYRPYTGRLTKQEIIENAQEYSWDETSKQWTFGNEDEIIAKRKK